MKEYTSVYNVEITFIAYDVDVGDDYPDIVKREKRSFADLLKDEIDADDVTVKSVKVFEREC